jgi:hypothetical protein
VVVKIAQTTAGFHRRQPIFFVDAAGQPKASAAGARSA